MSRRANDRRSNWLFWWFSLPVVATLLFLTVVGSRLLFNPQSVTVSKSGNVVMERTYPMRWLFGPPLVRYVTTVTPLTEGHNSGYPCVDDNYPAGMRYDKDHGGVGQWRICEWACDCLNDPTGFRFSVTYTAMLFDAIPLRPITIETMVVNAEVFDD